MKQYAGIDLHSNNSYVVIIDQNDKILYQKRHANDLNTIQSVLAPYKDQLEVIAVESTYNWFWLVDGLQEAGYPVNLVNPAALNQYSGIKYTDDKTDAHWLANLSRLGILPKAYIYPREQRLIRDKLRRRHFLVQQRSASIVSLQSLIVRYNNVKISADKIKNLTQEDLCKDIKETELLSNAKSELVIINSLEKEINSLEKSLISGIKQDPIFKLLKTIPGVGDMLAMTIALETGDISRFSHAGQYSSYCRLVHSERISNGKKKGSNNNKNGNATLAWAYHEAANFAIRYCPEIKKFYQRKLNKVHKISAFNAVAHKLARAAYYVISKKEVFEIKRCFN